MTRIRKVEIENFRSIRHLEWCPAPGVNCIIGPGDSGKSSLLDAIDLCLGARRTTSISDTDFHALDVSRPIRITITLGELPDALLSIETYGDYLRGFGGVAGDIEDEPKAGLETVLTLRLTVAADLEPVWSLMSARAEAAGQQRGLAWRDRQLLAPARIGQHPSFHLSWGRGSVLNRLGDEKPELGPALAKAARDARDAFGDEVQGQLAGTLDRVTEVAKYLGVAVGNATQALLDAHAVSVNDGAVALHSEDGVPLRSLGTGSTRLLIAGLQRAAAGAAPLLLVDEVEHGLDPHRLIRLLGSLGAKEPKPPLQVFMTTHSPIALRELAGSQVFLLRPHGDRHDVSWIGSGDDLQGTLRTAPEAFLATKVLVCEGASEIGFLRGLDQYRVSQGLTSMFALGAGFINSGGGSPENALKRGAAMLSLGYDTIVFVDSDKPVDGELLQAFRGAGGTFVQWRETCAIEDELFLSLDDEGVDKLLDLACGINGNEHVNENIKSASNGQISLADVQGEFLGAGYEIATRQLLGKTAKKGSGWFKSISKMERVASEVVGPRLNFADPNFKSIVEDIFGWLNG